MIKKPSSFNVLMCTLLLVFSVLSCRTRSGQKASKESDKKSAVDIDAEKTEEIADALINVETSVLDPVKLNKKALKSEVNQLTVGGSKRVITVKTTLNPVDQPHAKVVLVAESGKTDDPRISTGELVIGDSVCIDEGGLCTVNTTPCTTSGGQEECGETSTETVVLAPDENDEKTKELKKPYEEKEKYEAAKWEIVGILPEEACAYKNANPETPTDPSQKKMHDLKLSFCNMDITDVYKGLENVKDDLAENGALSEGSQEIPDANGNRKNGLSDAEIAGIVIGSVAGAAILGGAGAVAVSRRSFVKNTYIKRSVKDLEQLVDKQRKLQDTLDMKSAKMKRLNERTGTEYEIEPRSAEDVRKKYRIGDSADNYKSGIFSENVEVRLEADSQRLVIVDGDFRYNIQVEGDTRALNVEQIADRLKKGTGLSGRASLINRINEVKLDYEVDRVLKRPRAYWQVLTKSDFNQLTDIEKAALETRGIDTLELYNKKVLKTIAPLGDDATMSQRLQNTVQRRKQRAVDFVKQKKPFLAGMKKKTGYNNSYVEMQNKAKAFDSAEAKLKTAKAKAEARASRIESFKSKMEPINNRLDDIAAWFKAKGNKAAGAARALKTRVSDAWTDRVSKPLKRKKVNALLTTDGVKSLHNEIFALERALKAQGKTKIEFNSTLGKEPRAIFKGDSSTSEGRALKGYVDRYNADFEIYKRIVFPLAARSAESDEALRRRGLDPELFETKLASLKEAGKNIKPLGVEASNSFETKRLQYFAEQNIKMRRAGAKISAAVTGFGANVKSLWSQGTWGKKAVFTKTKIKGKTISAGTKGKMAIGAVALVFAAAITTAVVCGEGLCLAGGAEEGDDFTASLLNAAQAFNEFDLAHTAAEYDAYTDTLPDSP